MTPEQVDRIADHIADFSLSYIQQLSFQQVRSRSAHDRRAPKPRLSK